MPVPERQKGTSNVLGSSLTGGAYQKTQWVYGTSTGTSDSINSNDLLKEVRWPDKTSGNPSTTDKEVFTVNALGQSRTDTDRAGNVHALSYDVLGRLTADAVTVFGGDSEPRGRLMRSTMPSRGTCAGIWASCAMRPKGDLRVRGRRKMNDRTAGGTGNQ